MRWHTHILIRKCEAELEGETFRGVGGVRESNMLEDFFLDVHPPAVHGQSLEAVAGVWLYGRTRRDEEASLTMHLKNCMYADTTTDRV